MYYVCIMYIIIKSIWFKSFDLLQGGRDSQGASEETKWNARKLPSVIKTEGSWEPVFTQEDGRKWKAQVKIK